MNNKLAKYLAFFLVAFILMANSVRAADLGPFKVFKTKNGTFGFSKSNGNLVDIFYKRNGVEFRQFNNTNSTISFYTLLSKDKSITIGSIEYRQTGTKIYAVFSGPETFRNASSIDFCESKDFAAEFVKKTEEISKILAAYGDQNFSKFFDENSCSSVENKKQIFDRMKSSIATVNGQFKSCLADRGTVVQKLKDDPDFRRIMLTYFTNLYDFSKDFTSGKVPFQITCEKASGVAKINPGKVPFQISMSEDMFNGIEEDENGQKLSSNFERLFVHELRHVYTKIPPVANVEKCEHEYQDLIAEECKQGIAKKFETMERAKIPVCELYKPPPPPPPPPGDTGAVPQIMGARAEQASIAHPGSTAPTGEEGLGTRKDLTTAAARREQSSDVTVRGAESSIDPGSAGQQTRQQLTGSEETSVRRTADALFGPAQSGNTEIQARANEIFQTTNVARQQALAEEVAGRLDAPMDTFAKSAVALQGALGANAVAATLPAVSSQGVSRSIATTSGGAFPNVVVAQGSNAILSPQQAFNAYNTGNTGPAPAATPAVQLAGKISNSGGVSAMASAGGGGSARVNSSSAPVTASSKLSVSPGSAPQPIANENQVTAQPAYQLDGQNSGVRDTPTLRMLSSATTISGSSYQAIKKDYKSSDFVKGLKDRHILIRVVDPKTKKVQITYGMQAGPEGQVRQPSSIGSGAKAKKQSQPDIIFEDNGTSLRKKDN